jgi:glycosyltransferase involved in cell wall biosynthesis
MTAADVPDVSVVVPTRDRSSLLRRTLASVRWQEKVSFEVLVVDDGSTDDTPDVVARLGDPRVRYVRHDRPAGVSVARNDGAERARARWIAFLDDDDVWGPDKLVAQLEAARATGRRWVFTGSTNVTIDDVVLGGAPPPPAEVVAERLPRSNAIPGGCSGVVLDRELLGGAPPFDPTYRHFADWDLWIRLARTGAPASVPRPLVGYRVHTGNASHDTEGMLAELDVIERRYGGPVDRVTFLRHVARVARRGGRRRDALVYYLRAAAQGELRYLVAGFPADVGGLIAGTVRRDERRRRGNMPSAKDDAWLDEARAWIDRLHALTDD